jgi:hypothetical protein
MIGMCYNSAERTGAEGQSSCACAGTCPALLSVEEEIRLLEDHRKFMQRQVEVIDQKIAALKTVKES